MIGEMLSVIVNVLMAFAFLGIGLVSLHLAWIVGLHFRRHPGAGRGAEARGAPLPPDSELPTVLVQLPMFNERYVARRVIEAAAALDWPRDRLEIQVLDDSTDDTTSIAEAAVEELRRAGVNANLLHRKDRRGFKAGALEAGLACSNAPYVAMFDADFVPPADFLRRALPPLLNDPGLGLVQGRWDHLNPRQNFATRAQAMMMDAHFGVEQTARSWSGLTVPFNGTCGVWLRAAIDDAGGWYADTLTEDLDLSFRARLRGWRSRFLVDLPVPGELPSSLNAWRIQQFRWNKGFVQVARKLLPAIWRSHLPLVQKLAATGQMLQPCIFLCAIVAVANALFSPLLGITLAPEVGLLGLAAAVGGVGTAVVMAYQSQRLLRDVAVWPFLGRFLVLFSLNAGLAFSNARGVIEALAGRGSAFLRTPKRGGARRTSYRAGVATGLPELLFGLAGLGALALHPSWFLPFLLPSLAGFLCVGGAAFGLWIAMLPARLWQYWSSRLRRRRSAFPALSAPRAWSPLGRRARS